MRGEDNYWHLLSQFVVLPNGYRVRHEHFQVKVSNGEIKALSLDVDSGSIIAYLALDYGHSLLLWLLGAEAVHTVATT